MGTFDDLLTQVDAFIRKYYKNQMLRGVLLFALIFIVSYFVVVGLEYLGHFSSNIRLTLLLAFIGVNIFVFIKYIVKPITKLFSFGARIDRYQAAKIIGTFFPDVNDRLLNTLQLNDSAKAQQGNIELLQASVSQNAQKLSVFSFTSAVDYKENRKYLKYLLPILLGVIVIGFLAPSLFRDGTERLVKYNETFIPPAPFSFNLMNENLLVEEGADLPIELLLQSEKGEEIPNRVYIESDQGKFVMDKKSANKASYTFNKIKKQTTFRFTANGFYSKEYTVDVVGKASLGGLTASLTFPDYLGMKDQEVSNPGDLLVPEGTIIEWNGTAKNTQLLEIGLPDSLYKFERKGFRFASTFKESQKVYTLLHNNSIAKVDSLVYQIDVIKDAYPEIEVSEIIDSTQTKKRSFEGLVRDDHGLRNVVFTYTINKKEGEPITKKQEVPSISGTKSTFSMRFDISNLPISLEDELTYYFTVYDNDGVNGSKATQSKKFTYRAPSSQELNEKREASKEEAQKAMDDMITESKELNESIERLKMEMLNTANPSWKEQQQLEKIKEQRKSLEDRLEDLKKQMAKDFEEKSKLTPVEEDLLEKQKLLEELMDDIMDDELMDLLEQLEELMKNANQDGMQELMEDLEMNAEDMENQMDRTMEMLKQLDVEERIDDLENALDKLANDQDALKEDLEEGNTSPEDAKEKQKELNDQFKKVQEDIEKLMEKNEALKRPMDLDDMKEDQESVEESMENAKDNLEKNDSKKAQDEQKDASDKMKQMSSKMSAMKMKSKQKQQQEDIESLRRLLSNLMRLSFDQEQILDDVKETSVYSPDFGTLGRSQRSLIDNFRPVEDSLNALADRIPKAGSFINKEVTGIRKEFRNMIDDIDERRNRELLVKQQYAMTHLNNLALFLNESLENMQQDMQGQEGGEGACENPGGKGKGSQGDEMQNIKEMLKKQLEEMEKGNQPGGKKPGDKEGIPLPFGNKQAAQMAAQQNAMRKKLEQMKKDLNKDGKKDGEALNDLLKELEDQEKGLVNKKWDEEMVRRQKEILTRLLESEKALEERGFDEQRESKSGKDEDFGNQIEFLEYKKQKEKQIELLRTLDPSFSKYYKDRANEYFNVIN